MNEQHEWGGNTFRAASTLNPGGQTFLAGRPAADTDPPQAHFTASHSDDLFAPVSGGPSTFPPYILSHVPDPYPLHRDITRTPTASSRYNPLPNVQYPFLPPYNQAPVPRVHRPFPLHPLSPRIHSPVPHPIPPPPPLMHPAPYPIPYPSQLPLNYQPPPIQYVYVPAPPSDTTPTPSSKSLPVITSIHTLNLKPDFYAWDEGVCTLLWLLGIHGHIVDPLLPVDPLRPDISPALPPTLSHPPTPAEMKALARWQDNDNIAQYVLVGRLGSLARQLLPPAHMGSRTAFAVYTTITKYFGLRNFGDCDELATSLLQSRCEHNRVQDYVARWRSGVARLCSAKYPFSVRVFINAFVKSLPNTITFATLHAFLPDRLSSWNDSDIGPFVTITNEVMDLEVAFRNSSQSRSLPRQSSLPAPALPPPPPLPNPVQAPSSSAPPTSTRLPKQSLSCGNCKDKGLRYTGHTDGTCFQPGGGMEGRRDEYMSNKGRFHAMFVECLDNSSSYCDSTIHSGSLSPPSSPLPPPTLDDEIVLPPLANLCVASSVQNVDFRDDLYISGSIKFPSPFVFASIDFSCASMVSLVSRYNALLDSGCTHHIIRERHLFRSFLAKPISVGTANCGSLEALGTGDVEFRYPFGDRHVTFTLRGCLFAPTAPINLLSVGALVERGMSCLFSPGGITKVSYPSTHAKLPGFAFLATVSNRLSFLHLDFVPPLSPDLATAFPAQALIPPTPAHTPLSFPRLRQDSLLWHRRFGHIGMEATRFALTKDYVKGVQFEGSFVRDHCVPALWVRVLNFLTPIMVVAPPRLVSFYTWTSVVPIPSKLLVARSISSAFLTTCRIGALHSALN